MYTPQMIEKMNEYIRVVNDAVIEMLPSADEGQNDVVRAMRYSLANGGKRLRPIFTLEFCKMCGGDVEKALPLACAVEYIHTYSLIHDDLPCMDDDDMRRGNPSCHKMYGADIDGEAAAQAVSLLAQNAGVGGMIGGQVLDLKYETGTPSLTDVLTVYKLKTGALIAAACIMGCIAAGASSEQIEAASKYAYYLGIAFQIKDDLLDIYGDEAKLGKPIGSDENNDKSTYVTLTSAKKAEEDVANLTASAIGELAKFNDNEFLTELSRYLINREK